MEQRYSKGQVYSNIEVALGIFEMKIKGDFKGKPGQFYMLRAWDIEPFLSRPISICDVSEDVITFLYEVKGKGTDIFSKLEKGDSIYLLGPLGNGFEIEEEGKIAIVAGGIGIAPMVYLAKSLKCKIDIYAGYRGEPYILDKFEDHVEKIYISTENGAAGHKGYITELFNPEKYSLVISCGPTIMMEKVVGMCKNKHVPIYISMERRMACGFGACLGCTIETIFGMKRVCKDGPVFLGEEVVAYD